ncbi:MAG: hypothetical protein ABI548_01680 [Polyangiaceae bacterium]
MRTAAERALVAIELDRTQTPDEALGRRLLAAQSDADHDAAEFSELDAAEARLAVLERGRGAP